MASGRAADREDPCNSSRNAANSLDWGPIGELHQGRRSHAPHRRAGHMTAPDHFARIASKALARGGRPHVNSARRLSIPSQFLGLAANSTGPSGVVTRLELALLCCQTQAHGSGEWAGLQFPMSFGQSHPDIEATLGQIEVRIRHSMPGDELVQIRDLFDDATFLPEPKKLLVRRDNEPEKRIIILTA
jgi:hypothetical protein